MTNKILIISFFSYLFDVYIEIPKYKIDMTITTNNNNNNWKTQTIQIRTTSIKTKNSKPSFFTTTINITKQQTNQIKISLNILWPNFDQNQTKQITIDPRITANTKQSQPVRLNVYKNDLESFDYTNPGLGEELSINNNHVANAVNNHG